MLQKFKYIKKANINDETDRTGYRDNRFRA